MQKVKFQNGKRYKLVYAKRVRRDGKYVYPRKAKCFRFWVED